MSAVSYPVFYNNLPDVVGNYSFLLQSCRSASTEQIAINRMQIIAAISLTLQCQLAARLCLQASRQLTSTMLPTM